MRYAATLLPDPLCAAVWIHAAVRKTLLSQTVALRRCGLRLPSAPAPQRPLVAIAGGRAGMPRAAIGTQGEIRREHGRKIKFYSMFLFTLSNWRVAGGPVDDDDDTVIQAFVCFSDPDGWLDADK